jgi:hypothetical protein
VLTFATIVGDILFAWYLWRMTAAEAEISPVVYCPGCEARFLALAGLEWHLRAAHKQTRCEADLGSVTSRALPMRRERGWS